MGAPFHGALDIISSIPGAAPLRGLPRAMCCRPVNTGLLNSAHLRFAVQIGKLKFIEQFPRAKAPASAFWEGVSTRSPQAEPKTGA